MWKSLFLLLTLFTTSYSVHPPEITTSLENVREDLRIGDVAFTIKATDLDGDILIYGIDETKNRYNPFSVNESTGEVRIKTEIDRETTPNFPIDVFVRENFTSDLTEKKIFIVVIDANDNAPTFINAPYNIKLPENTAVNTQVFKVTATDPDQGPAGRVSYKIHQTTPAEGLNVFQIADTTGEVTLKEALNFTEKSTFYQLLIVASDGGGPLFENSTHIQSSNATAFITIIDVPDMDPQFLNLPGSAHVREHSSVGHLVFRVHGRDPDTGVNDVLHYTIEEASVKGLFEINQDTGEITVISDIDREALSDGTVTLTVKVTESGLNVNGVHASTTSTLTVQVDDINDQRPLFYKCELEDVCTEANEFIGEVVEHSSVGLSITGLNMKVEDKDAGENSRFKLSLGGPDKDVFSVSPTVGISDMSKRDILILIKDPDSVDFEKKQTMLVEVVAVDSGEETFVSTATVTIQVIDTNDNSPKFEKDAYNLNVPEHSENDVIVETITATDEDALDDGLLTYKLLPESIQSLFDVFPDNGTVYVKNGKSLDREQRDSYSATLQARDSAGNVGTTVLEIKIKDINDQTPKFIRNSYEVFVRENEMLNEQVEARDDDEPDSPNSKIIYAIKNGDYSANFTINKDTGKITNKETLDRESIDKKLNGKITLNVTATDMGTPPLSSQVKFIINVEDINDNAPVFMKPVYSFAVNESERGANVGIVYATDADQTGINNRLTFSITSGSGGTFLCLSQSHDSGYQGRIRVDPDVELDFESGHKNYTLIVEAADLGGNTTTCTVHVDVQDINDTPPTFISGLTWSVEENSRAGNEIGKIKGEDKDKGHELTYELVSTTCYANSTWSSCEEQWFVVEPNGAVKTADGVTIDYEKFTQVNLTARVVDVKTEMGRNSTEGFILIDIIDMNDNAPIFIPQQDFFVLITESIEGGRSVARVSAKDLDSGENKKIEFQVRLVQFVNAIGDGKPESEDDIFYADTEQPDAQGNYKGVIRASSTLQADKKGKYLVTVKAKNGELSTDIILDVNTVDSSYKVNLRFDRPLGEVNKNMLQIREALEGATKALVHVFKVSEDTGGTTRNVVTLVESYFVYQNGTALDPEDVGRILNSQEVYNEYGVILQEFGLRGILGSIDPPKEDNTVFFVMVGLVAGLAIVLVATTTSMVCIRKKYKTKLKAAKAMNTAAMANDEYQKDGPVVPGTNKYTREGANPVLNLNIDASTDLGFDEEASSADRESLNSLDENMDMTMDGKDTMPMTVIEEEDEYGGNSSYIEPLGAALAQRGRKKSFDSPGLTFTNPSLNTTDL